MKSSRDLKRRLPSDMVKKQKRVPISMRVLEETQAVLQVHAKKNGMSLGELAATVLDDYVIWLIESLKEQKTRR